MTTQLHCPYCYRALQRRAIKFRCSGRVGPTGRRCESKIDPVLSRETGETGTRPPAFAADGRRKEAVCKSCRSTTTLRICPHCHSPVPAHFASADSRLIALVGAKGCGKTVYVTVLLHELMNRVGERFRAAVTEADEHTLAHFTDEYEDQLYERKLLHATTTTATATAGGRRPLVFSFAVTARRLLRKQVRRTLLSFFDTAGEDLTTADNLARNARYLASADGIILLLDPLQMRGAQPLVAPGVLLPEPQRGGGDPMSVLTRITNVLHETLGIPDGDLIDKWLAVVFSKMDALDDALPPESPVLRDSPIGAAFDERDSLEVHDEIQSLLEKWQGTRLESFLAKNYRRYRFFGMSALGMSPVPDENGVQRVSDYGIVPRRVPDPFLWLLSEFGTVPTRKAEGAR